MNAWSFLVCHSRGADINASCSQNGHWTLVLYSFKTWPLSSKRTEASHSMGWVAMTVLWSSTASSSFSASSASNSPPSPPACVKSIAVAWWCSPIMILSWNFGLTSFGKSTTVLNQPSNTPALESKGGMMINLSPMRAASSLVTLSGTPPVSSALASTASETFFRSILYELLLVKSAV